MQKHCKHKTIITLKLWQKGIQKAVKEENAQAVANEWGNILNDLNALRRNDRAIRTALTTVLAVQKQRIFNKGQTAESGKIGKYSTNPISISRKNQARSTGHTYFKGGYAQYKSEIGKNPGFVNLRNTDQMMMDYTLQIIDQNTYGFGFTNDFNFDKSQWAEENFDKNIFDESTAEGNLMEKILTQELERHLR